MNASNELAKLQLRQLDRLLNLKKISFRDAHMVIFSDYPSEGFLSFLIYDIKADEIVSPETLKKISKEYYKLVKA